jgi:hypothetical protein
MRTSLHEIEQIEDYLLGKLLPEDALVFESRLLVSPMLRWQVKWQQKVHHLVKLYARKKWKNEAKNVHEAIFNNPAKTAFQKNIHDLFSS